MHFDFHHDGLGMSVETLNEQLGEYFGAPDNEGVLVREVRKNSLAEKSGFKAGDVIVRIKNKSVDDVDNIMKAIRKAKNGETLNFEVIRKGVKKTIAVKIEKEDEEEFECPFGGQFFHGEEFEMNPGEDFHIDIDRELGPRLQEEMNKLQEQLKHLDIPKRIRVHTSMEEI